MVTDPIQVALRVAKALEESGLHYLVGGSLASSISGEPRSTLDVDIVVAMSRDDVDKFIATLGGAFHVDVDALRFAIDQKSSTNLIDYATSTKVDLFIAGGSPLDEQQLARRRRVRVATEPDRELYVHTPEDILLQKLRWFRMGDKTSDQQWRDILGIVLVQGGGLDEEYLRQAADVLEVSDLLDRALREGSRDGSR